jgi:hypothetical protein
MSMTRIPIAPGLIALFHPKEGKDWMKTSLGASPSINIGEDHVSFFGLNEDTDDAALFSAHWQAIHEPAVREG